MSTKSFTPRELVGELDRYVVGQHKAKKAVSIALRNRWRRQQVSPELREEIAPKNILMIGPTGVGKTEIARRLAKLANAPFVKVEASKFTEVGYVGRDVESIVRDLVEQGLHLVRAEAIENVKTRAHDVAEERLVVMIAHKRQGTDRPQPPPPPPPSGPPGLGNLGQLFMGMQPPPAPPAPPDSVISELRTKLRAGSLDDESLELDVADDAMPMVQMFSGMQGMEDLEKGLRDAFSNVPGMKGRTKRRRVKVKDALKLLEAEEAQKLVDQDTLVREAIERTEQSGIVFLDEIDKIAGRQGAQHGPDVSREGVQRDLLPIVEGSTVNTKYGPVKTDHVLFIAAGAFHVAKVSDLIPELQGRFPIRVELESLGKDDFVRILKEPKNALTKQYQALLRTEGVEVTITDDAIEAMAEHAGEANERMENIGARRLHTILEAVFEELSYKAAEMSGEAVTIDRTYVEDRLRPILKNEDLSRFIL
ncbi:MAG: ATP-dependent protease ATPase subunit HslU [Deltaproteobacteria bacterium]|nr:ATP-dependent protease ATPase subunit HslU [Deltaproteobacteria bacterium]